MIYFLTVRKHSLLSFFLNVNYYVKSERNNNRRKKFFSCFIIVSQTFCIHCKNFSEFNLCFKFNPSLPQPVKFPGWMMQGRACKQCIFQSYNIYFLCYAFWWKSFHMPMPKRRQKRLKGFKFHTFMGRFEMISWLWRG